MEGTPHTGPGPTSGQLTLALQSNPWRAYMNFISAKYDLVCQKKNQFGGLKTFLFTTFENV